MAIAAVPDIYYSACFSSSAIAPEPTIRGTHSPFRGIDGKLFHAELAQSLAPAQDTYFSSSALVGSFGGLVHRLAEEEDGIVVRAPPA